MRGPSNGIGGAGRWGVSVYWTLVCDERKELVSPYALDGQGAKGIELTAPWSRFGALALRCMMNRWVGARVRFAQEFGGDGYKDVSFEVIADFNHHHGDDPAYPPIADPDHHLTEDLDE